MNIKRDGEGEGMEVREEVGTSCISSACGYVMVSSSGVEAMPAEVLLLLGESGSSL